MGELNNSTSVAEQLRVEDGLLFRDETYAINGAAIAVHKTLGPGFLESVYQEALEIEFRERGIPFSSQVVLDIEYRGHVLEKKFVADLICYDEIVIELKAVGALRSIHEAQLVNYLRATRMSLGLLLNFGAWPKLERKRLIN